MEDLLGVSIFERRPWGVKATYAGAEFLEAARRMLAVLDGATSMARVAGTASLGQLVIGTYFSASAGRFRDALIRFITLHRRVAISMIEGSRGELLTAVREGRADIALALGPADEPGLDRLALWEEVGMVALPERHRLASLARVTWAALEEETFVVTKQGLGPEARRMAETLLPHGKASRFVEQDVSREVMFNLVGGARLGVAVLAESASGATYPGVVFRPLGDEQGPTMIEVAAYWDPKRDNPALRRFLALLRSAQRVGSPNSDGD